MEDIFAGTSELARPLGLHLVATTEYSSPRSALNNQEIIVHTKQHFQKQEKKKGLSTATLMDPKPSFFSFFISLLSSACWLGTSRS